MISNAYVMMDFTLCLNHKQIVTFEKKNTDSQRYFVEYVSLVVFFSKSKRGENDFFFKLFHVIISKSLYTISGSWKLIIILIRHCKYLIFFWNLMSRTYKATCILLDPIFFPEHFIRDAIVTEHC